MPYSTVGFFGRKPKRLNKPTCTRQKQVNRSLTRESFFQKILVPVDDSVPSLAAQELAALISKKYASQLTVLHVVSHALMNPSVLDMVGEINVQEFAPSQIARGEHSMPRRLAPPEEGRPMPKGVIGEISDWYHERGEEIAEEAFRLFKDEGVSVDKRVIEHHDPASAIVRQVEHEDYDSVIIGRSGEKESQPHLGSTAERVVERVKVPVLVVTDTKRLSKILVPVDGSDAAEKALTYAVNLATKLDAKITLLHIQESEPLRVRPEIMKGMGDSILSKAERKAGGVELDKRMETGRPGTVITNTANTENYDVVVMGDKGHSSARRFLLGSTSNHVLHYSNRAILIVK
jgi:nucleotide-binding universal stress UspA family protein